MIQTTTALSEICIPFLDKLIERVVADPLQAFLEESWKSHFNQGLGCGMVMKQNCSPFKTIS